MRLEAALPDLENRTGGCNPPGRPICARPGHVEVAHHWGIRPLCVRSAPRQTLYEEYHPYGTSAYRSFGSADVSAKRYRYTGKERDEETGLYYHGARYYMCWPARWASVDPLGVGADGPGLYTYVRGSPIVMSDPSGMEGTRRYLGTDRSDLPRIQKVLGGQAYWDDKGEHGAGLYVNIEGNKIGQAPVRTGWTRVERRPPPPQEGGAQQRDKGFPGFGLPFIARVPYPGELNPSPSDLIVAKKTTEAEERIGYVGEYGGGDGPIATGFGGVFRSDGPGYNYAYVWRIGSLSAGDTPEGKMRTLKANPNAIFPFTVVPIDPGTGETWDEDFVPPIGFQEIRKGNRFDLQGALFEGWLIPKGYGPGHDPAEVVKENDTSFTFLTLEGHFDGPGAHIDFSTFAVGDDVMFMQRGYAPEQAPGVSALAVGITAIGSWRTQARNLAGYPNARTGFFSVDP